MPEAIALPKTHVLDTPLVLAGKASVGLLGATAPVSLTFNNGLTEDITVDVLIARDPTP